jgi:UDPglucose 6-dehydrogenase
MKVTVLGLWHLGCVTAACGAEHFDVTGLDFDAANIARLREGRAPIAEPGLDELIQAGLAAKRLSFTDDAGDACRAADLLWVAFDTPVDSDDRADVDSVLAHVRRCVPLLPAGALVLISSQLPVGTCRQLEEEFGPGGYRFACSPENLRLGSALGIFRQADRIIAGYRDERAKAQLAELFAPFTQKIVWMRPESAEMTKHAINSFLALSITFMNEIACLCERTGADAREVEQGLKSESRIGPKAYLSPGGALAGGTLARDVVACIALGEKLGEPLDVLPAIKRSNDRHRGWAQRKLMSYFAVPPAAPIALLGLTYKPGTDTLRRSSAVELAHALHARGFRVAAHDPSLPALPSDLSFVTLHRDEASLVRGAAALVVCTEWPQFRQRSDWRALVGTMSHPLVIDATRFLADQVAGVTGLTYFNVGLGNALPPGAKPPAPAGRTASPTSSATGPALAGLRVLITGANQGLGLEIARHFAKAGAHLAVCARDEAKLAAAAADLRAIAGPGQKIFARKCDVSNPADVQAFADTAIAELGSVEVVINNAGVYGPKGPSESVDWEEWKRAMEINLYGVLLPCRALIPHLKAQGRGKIINLSGGGATSPMPNISAYAASKAAVVRLTETLAGELRDHRIDVNAVAPGALNTRLLEEVLQAGPESVGEAFYQKAIKQKETGGTSPDLAAKLCAYLASPESDGITGKLISAQWDPWKDLAAHKEELAKSDIYTLRRIVPEDRGQHWSS